MSNSDSGLIAVPHPTTKAVSVERGGRFGLRVAVEEVPEGVGSHLLMAVIAAVAAVVLVIEGDGGVGTAAALGAAFIAGFAICNALWIRQGEPVEERITIGGDSA